MLSVSPDSTGAPHRNPVLLVHGLQDTQAKFRALGAHLRERGWSVHALDLRPNDGRAPLEVLAGQVADYAEEHFSPDQPFDLLGFSMGGLVTRYYLQRLGGAGRVQRYLNIAAPNNGTWLAQALPLPGISQMRPGSTFLTDLNRDHRQVLAPLQVTVMWTPFDLMILPAQSSCLGLGEEIVIPAPVHGWLMDDPRTLTAVERCLAAPFLNGGKETWV
ncbi:MAG: alpha/beta fold hydrolase [Cyanobacteriota bacterium]|jgi:triacylglycerol lipase